MIQDRLAAVVKDRGWIVVGPGSGLAGWSVTAATLPRECVMVAVDPSGAMNSKRPVVLVLMFQPPW